ncbi:MFS transporter (macronuclear) [Tetrahymena thermophila SB210]|uniref:MFS transporter n=1 Tax=Tetrahymena thermophila (strain SB210) TaxID=312017 RepID=I7MEJ1_TETTS|nr:MFS transporter [Tetrahymena thermophila SB210]EAR96454.1 MFS transporter [Tetrahymena thermophila SB210]|eukprot:XP_001016699.1 MFS transporter [Tetrahymena thermophila SB210]
MGSDQDKRAKKYQIFIFVFTFLCYAAVHSTRTAWSVSKSNLKSENSDITDTQLGYIDFSFLFCYSLALKIGGGLGDKINLKYYLSFGMMPASIFLFCIAIMGWSSFVNMAVYGVFMALNGIFQSTGWPGLVATMGNWFGKGNRGLLMGIWSGNSNVGNILGQLFGQLTIDTFGWGWEYCLMFSSIFLFTMGVLTFIFLKPYPKQVGIYLEEEGGVTEDTQRLSNELSCNSDGIEQPRKQINYFTAWCVPGVPLYAIAYACLKSSSYGLLFWLPSYISDNNMDSYSYTIPMMNDIGNFIGGVITGYLSDKNGKRSFFLLPQLVVAAIFMALVKFTLSDNPLPYFFVIFAIGFFLGGPYNILSAAISIDLAKQPALKGQKSALSTISSLIEGIGSLCAAITQIIIPQIGQNYVFVLFMTLISVSVIFLIPLVVNDFKDLKKEKSEMKMDLIED